MTMATKKEYLKIVRKRYQSTNSRKEKSRILDEVVHNTGMTRKGAIRSLNRKERKYRRKGSGRKTKYTYDLKKPLSEIWEILGKPCSKNLHPAIPTVLDKLKKFDEINISDRQEKLLLEIKPSTIDKLLASKKKNKFKGLSGTKTSPHLKQLIPIRTRFDENTSVGELEMDCVLHCGGSVSGIYAETLNMLDIKTMWDERAIFLKKTSGKVIGALHQARKRFPFPIKSIDFDNGFEFVNYCMVGYCKRENIDFTRSRSYHKNDQAHIEGKNNHSVRKVIGYARIEEKEIVDLISDIYNNELRLLTNYFYPVRKLIQRETIGSKTRKKYDEAKTPYQRVLESDVDIKVKMRLKQEYAKLNPAQLHRDLNRKLTKLNRIISVTSNYQATICN